MERDIVEEMVGHVDPPKQVNNMRDERGRLLPGKTANPNGRPKKGYSITETFREMFTKDPQKKLDLANTIFAKAVQGDAAAQKLVWNYMDGMPKQGVEVTGEDGGDIPVHIRVTYE